MTSSTENEHKSFTSIPTWPSEWPEVAVCNSLVAPNLGTQVNPIVISDDTAPLGSASNPIVIHVLIFSHFSEERDGVTLMESLARALETYDAKPDHVIFTTYQEREDGYTRIDKTLKVPETPFPDLCTVYSFLWKKMHPDAAISTEPTIQGAIRLAERISVQKGGMHAFVTGSLHLVGGALSLLRP